MGILEALKLAQQLRKLQKYAEKAAEIDATLKTITVGNTAGLDLPDELDVKFTSKSGKRFSIDGVLVKRLA